MKKACAGLAAALALFVVELQAPRTADACGVKLIVKTPNPRQAVARSSRPSDVLVLGGKPIREPVFFHGPFVMNTRQEIFEAIEDYHAGRLGKIPASYLAK